MYIGERTEQKEFCSKRCCELEFIIFLFFLPCTFKPKRKRKEQKEENNNRKYEQKTDERKTRGMHGFL